MAVCLVGGLLATGCGEKAGQAEALFKSGQQRYDRGDWTGAIADLTRALELDPKLIGAYDYRGCAHTRTGDWAGAIGDFDRLIQLDPKDSAAHEKRALAKSGRGDVEGASADLNQAIELSPTNAWA